MGEIIPFKKRAVTHAIKIQYQRTDDGKLWYRVIIDGVPKEWKPVNDFKGEEE